MLENWYKLLLEPVKNPELIKNFFYQTEILYGVILGAWCIYFFFVRTKESSSQFRTKEFERLDLKRKGLKKTSEQELLAEATIQKKTIPLLLPTHMKLEGAAHEILGIPHDASIQVVQTAYRKLMKRYHPDAVFQNHSTGHPSSTEWQSSAEWKEAQRIAIILSQAKEEMMARRKSNLKKN